MCADKSYRSKKNLRVHLRDILLMLFVFGPLTLFFACTGCFDTVEMGITSSLYSGFSWIALWKGNELGATWLDYKVSWFDNPGRRFIVSILYTVLYTGMAVIVLHYFFYNLYLGYDFERTFISDWMDELKWPFTITFIISAVMHGRGFLYSWRQSAVNVEKLKREQLSSKYESLRQQVNPHFLFNSLNALTSLVHKDADLSEKFIKQLSDVYRYVLDSQDKEVVNLKEELAFTEAFIFLQQIRYGDNLKVDIDIPEKMKSLQVPPLAFQMLIENAIKHNVISDAKPLSIKVDAGVNWLTVTNKLQRRRTTNEEASGIGINNIKLRYEYLSDKEIIIEETGDHFTVKLPLLKYYSNESTGS